jgi:hypothetical protein
MSKFASHPEICLLQRNKQTRQASPIEAKHCSLLASSREGRVPSGDKLETNSRVTEKTVVKNHKCAACQTIAEHRRVGVLCHRV